MFERGGSLREGVAVEITPDDGPAFAACVEGNPFGRGLVSLLLKHHAEESGGAFVKRLIFISGEGLSGYHKFSIIVELGRRLVSSSPG